MPSIRTSPPRANDAWAPTRTPTAAGFSRHCGLPDFRGLAIDVKVPGAVDAEAPRVMGQFLRDVMKKNARPQELPTLRSRRGGVEPLDAGPRGDRSRLDGRHRKPRTTTSRRDGRVMEILSEHTCVGWMEGYLTDRATRSLLHLRGVRPHHRFDVQPARQMAQAPARTSPGGPDVASWNVLLS